MFKKIGVMVCEVQGVYQTKLLTGINTKAAELGYDVLVFGNFCKTVHNINKELHENNIFNMINFAALDGLIVLAQTFAGSRLEYTIFDILRQKCHCPVVIVDSSAEHDFENVFVDDSLSFEELTDHLIDEHGCRDLLFYSGSEDESSTQVRLKGFRASLQKHGIEETPEMVSFEGDFWYPGGEKLAQDIIDGKRHRPEAILFCGDYMALGAHKTFSEAGWKIPEDIKLAGYDAVPEGLDYQPLLTSYDPPVRSAGENAVVRLDEIIMNKPHIIPAPVAGRLRAGGSCGCTNIAAQAEQLLAVSKEQAVMRQFFDSYILEDLSEAEDFISLQKQIQIYTFLIPGWKDFYLCLESDWMRADQLSVNTDMLNHEGYPDTLTLYIKAENNSARLMTDRFSTSRMLPALYEEHDSPKTYYFTPLHMNRKSFGYAVITYHNRTQVPDSTYYNWSRHVSLALSYYCIQAQISADASVDILTGAYTRRGMEYHMAPIREKMADPRNETFTMIVDLDRLKKINDKHGHECGDAAIREIAHVLMDVKAPDELCCRTGGDEFVIVGCDWYPDDYVDTFIRAVNAGLEAINKAGTYPFPLSASMGGVLCRCTNLREIDKAYKKADHLMYEMKKKHHSMK